MVTNAATAAARSLLVRNLRSKSKLLVRNHNSSYNRNNVLLRATAATTTTNRFSSTTSITTTTTTTTSTSNNHNNTMSVGQSLTALASTSPHVEVIRYEHKNVKWSVKHMEFFADALAVGMLDAGLAPGDAVLSWLPLHFSEQHILQFACSKAGFVLYHLDPALATSNPTHAKTALGRALELSEATVLVSQDIGSGVRYVDVVKELVPETRIFCFQDGMPFFTPRYPHLRYPMHVGFDGSDDKYGFCLLRHFLLPHTGELSTMLEEHQASLDGETALVGEFVLDEDGVPTQVVATPTTNKDVLDKQLWPEICSVLNKEYKEIEGVGVIF